MALIHAPQLCIDQARKQARGRNQRPSQFGRNHRPFVAFDTLDDILRALLSGDRHAAGSKNAGWRLAPQYVALKVGIDVAGAHQHGVDPGPGQFNSQAVGKGTQRVFGGGIERQPGQRHLSGDRPDVHNHALPLGPHVRYRGLDERQRRHQIQLKHLPGIVHRRLPAGSVQTNARIVDQHIHPAKSLHRLFHGGGRKARFGKIAGDREQALNSLHFRRVASHAGHLRATREKQADTGQADPFARPGYQDNFARAIHLTRVTCHVTIARVLIPLFPLNVVLLPGTQLPLHIFEERYKEMIGAAIHDESVFGVVLAIDGGVVNLGCSARIERVLDETPDGQMDILTVGESRFEIVSLNQERNFLQGEVNFFSDAETEGPLDLRERAIATFRQAFPAPDDEWPFPVDLSHKQLSFQLAQGLSDLEFKQQLLATRSEPVRLRKLVDFFPGFAQRQLAVEQIKKVANTNGHGRHYPPTNS